ncbi:MAG: hypothetical protein CMJ45_07340 [Planctomyces sp.]|nr:hypothetical protein [Planctomyces sp.]
MSTRAQQSCHNDAIGSRPSRCIKPSSRITVLLALAVWRLALETPSVPSATTCDLIDRYGVLLLDAYGVLVHSRGAYPGAVELIQYLNRSRKPYYLVTNDAARLPSSTAIRYQGFGLDIDADRIITSGSLLLNYFAEHGLSGAKCSHIR